MKAGSIPVPCSNKKTAFVYRTNAVFLSDVCLRQMMLGKPNDVRFANDAWLRHIVWLTSHHCGTKWRNIILSVAKSIISPQAMHHSYAQGTKDFISKFEIALKEASETGYWLELLYRTKYIDEQTFKALSSKCTSLRVMLIAFCKTAKEKLNKKLDNN